MCNDDPDVFPVSGGRAVLSPALLCPGSDRCFEMGSGAGNNPPGGLSATLRSGWVS